MTLREGSKGSEFLYVQNKKNGDAFFTGWYRYDVSTHYGPKFQATLLYKVETQKIGLAPILPFSLSRDL